MYMYINNPLMPDFSLASVHLFSEDLDQIVRICCGDVLMKCSSISFKPLRRMAENGFAPPP